MPLMSHPSNLFTNMSILLLLLLFLSGFLSFTSDAAPFYRTHVCSDGSFFKTNSTFQANLNVLLSSLTSNASLPNDYYRTAVSPSTPPTITGLFLCRGDVNPEVCQSCVGAASTDITRRCPNQTESIIWYDECMLRYSNAEMNPMVPAMTLPNESTIASSERDRFDAVLSSMLNDVTQKANTQTGKKFATAEVHFKSLETLYGLAQCTPDSSDFSCNSCFRSAIGFLPDCCSGSKGAMILVPSCNIRYEFYPFYNITHLSSEPLVPPTSSGSTTISMIVAIVVPVVVVLALLVVGCGFLRKRANKKYNTFTDDSSNISFPISQ